MSWEVIPIAALAPVLRPVGGGLLAARLVEEGFEEEGEVETRVSDEVEGRG